MIPFKCYVKVSAKGAGVGEVGCIFWLTAGIWWHTPLKIATDEHTWYFNKILVISQHLPFFSMTFFEKKDEEFRFFLN